MTQMSIVVVLSLVGGFGIAVGLAALRRKFNNFTLDDEDDDSPEETGREECLPFSRGNAGGANEDEQPRVLVVPRRVA
jgi:hypothetical protein